MAKDISEAVGDIDGGDFYTPQASGAPTTDDPVDFPAQTLVLLLQKWGNGAEGVSDLATRLAASMTASGALLVTAQQLQQIVYAVVTATAAGTAVIPYDATIPQNDEGIEAITKAITPNLASNLLVIEGLVHLAHNAGSTHLIVSLFKDDDADAIDAEPEYMATADKMKTIPFKFQVIAGDLTERTYKVRVGAGQAGTITLNGDGTTSIFPGILKTSLQISQYK